MNNNIPHWVRTPWGNGPYFSVSLEGFNTNEKNLNISTANEDGQNRQDEQNDKNKPVIVKISEKIIKNENFYNKFLSGMQENLEINPKNKIYPINKKNIRNLKFSLVYNGPIVAPVQVDEKIAELIIYNKDQIVKKLPLYAAENLKKVNFFRSLFTSINYLIWGDV